LKKTIDWQAQRVRVRQSYVAGELGTPKSRRSTGSVPMSDEVGGALERLFQQSAKPPGDDDLAFRCLVSGGPLGNAGIVTRYKAALKAAGLDQTHTFHHLTHSFGRPWRLPVSRRAR
jgi:hypothetical protein